MNLTQNTQLVNRGGSGSPGGSVENDTSTGLFYVVPIGVSSSFPICRPDAEQSLSSCSTTENARKGGASISSRRMVVAEQWASFLKKYDWDHYSHFTFRPNVQVIGLNRRGVSFIHPESAVKALKRLVYGLNEEIFGRRFYKRPHEGIIVAAAMERQKSGNPHFHTLMGNIPGTVRRMGIVDKWYKTQGIARVFEYQKDMGAEEYISKLCYMFKDGKLEIDLLGPLGAYQPAPVM